MRISDWSSDVCSSDLLLHKAGVSIALGPVEHESSGRGHHAINVGHVDTMRLQHLHKLHLMFERIGNRFPRPHAPHQHDRIRPLLREIHAPHRPPAATLLDAPYISPDIPLPPPGDGT